MLLFAVALGCASVHTEGPRAVYEAGLNLQGRLDVADR